MFRFPRKKDLKSAGHYLWRWCELGTQVWWWPSEASRPVHDVVWKLNRLATKTKSTLLITFVGACDWYGTYHLYVHVYIYTEVSFFDKIHLGNIFCCCSSPIVFWHTIWRGDDFSLNQELTLNTLLNSCWTSCVVISCHIGTKARWPYWNKQPGNGLCMEISLSGARRW